MWGAEQSHARTDPDLEHPAVTREWVRTALKDGQTAFEREMERDRKELEAKFHRFWKERGSVRRK